MEFLLVSFPVNQPFDIQCEREHQCCHDLLQDLNECFVTVGKMTGIQYLAFVWTLFIIHTGFAFGDIQFLERHEGESVVLPCVVEQKNPSPFGVYLKRGWLHPGEVLFMHTKSEFTPYNSDDTNRTSVSGDPSNHSVKVTLSLLRVSDTDRYYCEFVVNNPNSEDEHIRGMTEFFLLVKADAPGSVDIEFIETCVGGSAVLPCVPSQGEGSAVQGVSVKRRRGRAPVEVVYHSNPHHSSSSSSPPSISSLFPAGKVQLSLAPSPGGITCNVTLQQLQPDDSALYSCQLHMHGRSDSSTALGRRVFFVSVQGEECGCSGYSTLLFALFSAVVVFIVVLIGVMVIYKCKARRSVKSRPAAPIYEEMTGVQPLRCKLPPNHLEETESSEYRNCKVKKPYPENHYECPTGALRPRTESQK
ncbi:cd7 antigen-like [Anabas testudineus]|uniref:cd7 antigen-like n=1 Tax=Anabas testudineus TaxID=64144 RepID=UPI000E4659A9|nr:cd7 antigen-like [Anabas testudineus]